MALPSRVEEHDTNAELHLLLVQIADELYAIPSPKVREVVRYRSFTPVPGAPPTLPGILNHRGAILPVIEVRLLLGLAAAMVTRATRFVMASHDDTDLALLVDSVLDLIILPTATVEALPNALDPARARFLNGVIQYNDQPVALLDIAEVIAGLRDWS